MQQLCACCSWQRGAGIFVEPEGNATLIDSNVYQNEALDKGGGLSIKGTAALTNVNVYANRAENVCASPFELCLGTPLSGAQHQKLHYEHLSSFNVYIGRAQGYAS